MRRATILALAAAFISIWIALASGVAAGSLRSELKVLALVFLPIAAVASLLVLYFDWRSKLRHSVRPEHDHARKAA